MAYGAYGAQGSSFKDSQLDSFGADSAYGFQEAEGAYGASEFVAQPQEFGMDEGDSESQFRFFKKGKKKLFLLVKDKGGHDDHDDDHEEKEDKHVHKHQHLHYDNYNVHQHGGHDYGHGGGLYFYFIYFC